MQSGQGVDRDRALGHYRIVEKVLPMRFAWVCASLGDPDTALKWLEKSYEERDGMLWWLNVMPPFDPLRSDPRFQDLLQRLHLAD